MSKLDLAFNNVKPKDWYFVLIMFDSEQDHDVQEKDKRLRGLITFSMLMLNYLISLVLLSNIFGWMDRGDHSKTL